MPGGIKNLEDQVALLSVGRAEKNLPRGLFDFVATAGRNCIAKGVPTCTWSGSRSGDRSLPAL